MTRDDLIKWVETGDGNVTLDDAREELRRCSAALVAVLEAVGKLRDETMVQADQAIEDMAYRAERAAEYALLSSLAQRLADAQAVAAYEAQR